MLQCLQGNTASNRTPHHKGVMGPRGFKTFTEERFGLFYDRISFAEFNGKRLLIDAASLRGTAGSRPNAFVADAPARDEVKDRLNLYMGSREEYTSNALKQMINRLNEAGAEMSSASVSVGSKCSLAKLTVVLRLYT